MNVKKVLEIVKRQIMRWVFEICLFVAEWRVANFGSTFFSIIFDALVFPTDGT